MSVVTHAPVVIVVAIHALELRSHGLKLRSAHVVIRKIETLLDRVDVVDPLVRDVDRVRRGRQAVAVKVSRENVRDNLSRAEIVSFGY